MLGLMKALFCTLVDDAAHYSAGDDGGDVRRVDRVRNPFRDNTDRSKMDTSRECCWQMVRNRLMAGSVN